MSPVMSPMMSPMVKPMVSPMTTSRVTERAHLVTKEDLPYCHARIVGIRVQATCRGAAQSIGNVSRLTAGRG